MNTPEHRFRLEWVGCPGVVCVFGLIAFLHALTDPNGDPFGADDDEPVEADRGLDGGPRGALLPPLPRGGPPRAAINRWGALCGQARVLLDWHTPAERYDGTPFTARGFERVPALDHLQGWLANLMTV